MSAAESELDDFKLTVASGQLRDVIKDLHDRGSREILLVDLLDRLRVGPLQLPASEYVDVRELATREQISEHLAELRARSGPLES